jgi:hypothetical protein
MPIMVKEAQTTHVAQALLQKKRALKKSMKMMKYPQLHSLLRNNS